MQTQMTTALSLLLLALIPATIAAPPPSSKTTAPIASSTRVSVQQPQATGHSCPANPAPNFPAPIDITTTTCTAEGAKACTVDETSLLTCTGGKWVATNCGSKDGYHMACRSYANLMMVSGCPSYGPVYTECTGYEDADVPESVSSMVGWDAQATAMSSSPAGVVHLSTSAGVPLSTGVSTSTNTGAPRVTPSSSSATTHTPPQPTASTAH